MHPPQESAVTRSCTMWIDGIVRARFHDGVEVTLADAQENLAAVARMTNGQRLPVLVDLRPVRSQTAEARAYLAGPNATAITLAVALVIGSPVSRVIGSFYLGFNRPQTPTKLFTSIEDAEAWLATFQV